MVGGVGVADTTIGFQFGSGGFAARSEGDVGDHALVERLCAGEESAYETLLTLFEKPVYNLVSRLTDNRVDAADAVQEVFLKVFRNVGSFRGDSSLKTWIYRIAVNEARNQRRWLGRHKHREVCLDPEPGDARGAIDLMSDPGLSPLEETLQHEAQALLEAALAQVNPSFRTVLVLREIEDMSYDEIADVLEISLGTVKSRILRGREALRERFEKSSRSSAAPAAAWRGKELITG